MNAENRKHKRTIIGELRVLGLIGFLFLSVMAMAQTVSQGEVVNDNSAGDTKNGILKNWFIGVNGGGTFLISSLHEKPYSWAVGAVLGKQLNRKVGIRADYLYGKMHAEGIWEGLPLANDVDFMDAALMAKLSLNDFVFTTSPKFIREFYLLGGVGATFFNSKVINTATNTFVIGQGWDNTGTNKTSMVTNPFVPIGAGLAVNIEKSGRIFLNAEFTYRYSQQNRLDGGLTSKASNYTYTSIGLTYTIGKPTFSPSQISSDVIENNVKTVVTKDVTAELTAKIESEIQPIKAELEKQRLALDVNNEIVAAMQDEVESRLNALSESFQEGVVTTKLPDGTTQTTPLSQMAAGSIPTLTSIYFAFNSLYITPDMEREIAVIAKILKKNKELKCEITGNASVVGGPDYNLALSQKRADAVALLLVEEFGIEQDRLIVKSVGLTDPLAKNLQKINRRVDLQLFR